MKIIWIGHRKSVMTPSVRKKGYACPAQLWHIHCQRVRRYDHSVWRAQHRTASCIMLTSDAPCLLNSLWKTTVITQVCLNNAFDDESLNEALAEDSVVFLWYLYMLWSTKQLRNVDAISWEGKLKSSEAQKVTLFWTYSQIFIQMKSRFLLHFILFSSHS